MVDYIVKEIPFWHIDAFSDRPFKGNPAGVCLLNSYPSDGVMQKISSEINLSETAFIVPTEELHLFRIRWFTPETEVPLCGHATLAGAKVIFSELNHPSDFISFESLSGNLPVKRLGSGMLQLDFPIDSPIPTDIHIGMSDALGISDCLETAIGVDRKMLVVELASPDDVAMMKPDFHKLRAFDTEGKFVIVIVTAKADEDEFVSRVFAPWIGIDEDPVTGSAQTVLAPYWRKKLGKDVFVSRQISRRGGLMNLEIVGERCLIAGHAVKTIEGTLFI